jgi:hypothetical protein
VKYFYLLGAGVLVSSVHFYLVWHHRDNRRYSVSEHAILTNKSHLLYFVAHVICDVLFLLYSYQFFVVEQGFYLPHYLNINFAVFDFAQAVLPSRGKTEKAHIFSAYFSWLSYLAAGTIALFGLSVAQPYSILAMMLLLSVAVMFVLMHKRQASRSGLYRYQLITPPLLVVYMLLVTIGAN